MEVLAVIHIVRTTAQMIDSGIKTISLIKKAKDGASFDDSLDNHAKKLRDEPERLENNLHSQ